jgi:hypothetical protein
MSAKKQNFAAAAFLSSAEKPESPVKPAEKPEVSNAETKTRRVQLLLKPSDYEKLRRIADKQQSSVNRVIEALIADAEE